MVLKNGKVIQPLAAITLKTRRQIVLTARSAELELTHDLTVLPSKDGFLERIQVVNRGPDLLEIEDYRFGLRRPADGLQLSLTIAPRSPLVVEIATAVAPAPGSTSRPN